MKKLIKTAEELNPVFNQLADSAIAAGYDLNVDGHDIILTTDNEMFPTLDVISEPFKDGFTYDVTMSFPVLNADNMEYVDSAEYYIKLWLQIAKFVTQIHKFTYSETEESEI